MYNPKYLTRLDQITEIPAGEREKLEEVTKKFMFRTNDYYQKLINWDDPDDPIRRIVIPSEEELLTGGRLDASDEEEYTVIPGLEHKYEFTALLLVNDVCGAYCRFCFRKRLFMNDTDEVIRDVTDGIKAWRVRVNDRCEEMTNLWSGLYDIAVGCMVSSATGYQDYLGEITDGTDVNYVDVSNLTTSYAIYFGFVKMV